MELSNAFVIAMGMGIVFCGLICLIVLTTLMSAILSKLPAKKQETAPAPAAVKQAAPAADAPIPNRPEFIAAVSAAIAEDIGEDVSAIRIVSVKRV